MTVSFSFATRISNLLAGDINLLQHWFRRNLPGHVPYDCRRTFVTRASECGIKTAPARF